MAHPTYTLLFVSKKENFQEGIKGLILRHCGKQNFIYHGKLRLPQLVYSGAPAHKVPQYTRYYPSCTAAHVLRQPTFKFIAAAVHEG